MVQSSCLPYMALLVRRAWHGVRNPRVPTGTGLWVVGFLPGWGFGPLNLVGLGFTRGYPTLHCLGHPPPLCLSLTHLLSLSPLPAFSAASLLPPQPAPCSHLPTHRLAPSFKVAHSITPSFSERGLVLW